jgi:predicted nucleotidyltransferase component of viral defense system
MKNFQIHSLHTQTQAVFATLAASELTRGFLLIGGTALALHIAHRVSNDLDFLFTQANGKLPTQRIDQLVAHLRAQGRQTELITDSSAELIFRVNTGEHLSDYARDYAIDNVKVTFFAANAHRQPKRFAFWENAPRDLEANCTFSVLSLDGLKIAKTLVLQDRVRSRDLFDLMILIRDYGYTIDAMFDNVRRLSDGAADGEIERLILRGLIPIDRRDEGLKAVNVSVSLAQLYAFFDERLREYEVRIHAQHIIDAKPQSHKTNATHQTESSVPISPVTS